MRWVKENREGEKIIFSGSRRQPYDRTKLRRLVEKSLPSIKGLFVRVSIKTDL